MDHKAIESSESNPYAAFRALIGAVLVGAGIYFGWFVLTTVLQLINGDEPPKMLMHITSAVAEKVEAEVDEKAEAEEIPKIDLPPDIKRGAYYGLAFLLLTLPTMITSALLSNGVKIMHAEANEVLRLVREKLQQD